TSEIKEALEKDPVLLAAMSLIAGGALDARAMLELDRAAEQRARAAAKYAGTRPKLESQGQVMEAIARPIPRQDTEAVPRASSPDRSPLTLAQGISAALAEALEQYPEAVIFGEDVAKKGGVYGVTKGLLDRFHPARVFNTLLDEQTILGIALGLATLGLLPIPEIQYLAFLHNAEDQLRAEAATLPFFSNRAYDNPMLVRIAGLAYQKGFGGHFHNDNSLAVLRDIPGLIVFVPARADDAGELYRAALTLARQHRRVMVAVEPIALYHVRDLHEPKDGAWMAADTGRSAPLFRARVYQADASDLLIATYGNGLYLSLRAARNLARDRGIRARVLDLRWLAPLPLEDVLRHATETGRLLVVDECRAEGNISEALAAAVVDAGAEIRFRRVTSAASFIPLGEAAELVLASESEIFDAACGLVG
ncbi:MAG TPA: transketolase C-terminal domain-containing protein, partial [Polyangiaceae bacterium]